VAKLPPICLSLLLCDELTRDVSGRKTSIIGTFHLYEAPVFPTVVPRCAVWVELTDGHGAVSLALKLIRVTPRAIEGELLLEAPFTVTFTDPRTIHRHHLSVAGLELPGPGEYWLSLEASGRSLFERRLVALTSGAGDP